MPKTSMKPWEVLTNEDVATIAKFGDIPADKVRGVELLVLIKLGRVKV